MLPLLLCLSAVTLDATAAVNILALFPHPGKSHFMVFEPLVHELARRGHNLTVLSFFPSPTPRSNYRDISLEGLVEAHVATVNMTNFEPLYGLERVLHHYTDMSRLARYAVEVCERLMSWPAAQELLEGRGHYDVILVETFNSDCVLGAAAAAYRAPVVGISAQQLLPWVADRMGVPLNAAHMPLLILPLGGRMSVLERLENAFFTQFYKVWFRWQVQVKEQAILERRLGAAAPDLATVVAQTSMILANTHHCLNGVWPLPPGVIEVGGLHLTPSEEVIPAALERVLAAAGAPARPGVVLVSFGSLLNGSTMPAPRVHAMLAAFARLPHTFVWKWEADVPPAGPDNVFFYKWIPQQMLLKHPKVVAFIAHGGLLGMTEAVAAGVPMLVVPFFGDQPGNAAAAQDAGLATVLPYKNLDEENLYAALQKVLSPEMRASAARVSRVWLDRPAPPLDTAVYWVERTSRLGRDQQMASQARYMPAYQLALIDVMAIAAVLVAITLMTVYGIIKMLARLLNVCRSDEKKKKKN